MLALALRFELGQRSTCIRFDPDRSLESATFSCSEAGRAPVEKRGSRHRNRAQLIDAFIRS